MEFMIVIIYKTPILFSGTQKVLKPFDLNFESIGGHFI